MGKEPQPCPSTSIIHANTSTSSQASADTTTVDRWKSSAKSLDKGIKLKTERSITSILVDLTHLGQDQVTMNAVEMIFPRSKNFHHFEKDEYFVKRGRKKVQVLVAFG